MLSLFLGVIRAFNFFPLIQNFEKYVIQPKYPCQNLGCKQDKVGQLVIPTNK
jgi:hypothetical protein